METIESKLHDLGLALPDPPTPGGNYLPFRINGNTLYLAGTISSSGGAVTQGQVGDTRSVDEGYAAARLCALNTLAAIKAALGTLDRVQEFLYVGGYVSAVAGFDQSPQVINGASDLFAKLYGDAGKHARAAVAVAGLPRGATVEIQVIVRFAD
jgi:enamine deaminase RidA (YjgF/YER057c/UK114 family)